jgi:hypothetical protein
MQAQGMKIINNMQIETSTGTVYWQEDEPTNPKDNDTWFKVVNGTATNAYNRVDGEWIETAFASQIIAEELVGKILTAAEINGGVINGITMNASEFRNTWKTISEETATQVDGNVVIADGVITQTSNNRKILTGGTLQSRQQTSSNLSNGILTTSNSIYSETDGSLIRTTGARLFGGYLELNWYEPGKGITANATLDAQTLYKMLTLKTKTFKIADTSNFKDAEITYTRQGDMVNAQIYFNLLSDTGWVGLSPFHIGYKPKNYIQGTGILPSISYQGVNCTVYSNNNGWRLIPQKSTKGAFQGSLTYTTIDDWNLA